LLDAHDQDLHRSSDDEPRGGAAGGTVAPCRDRGRGGARIIAATGASQFEFLDALTDVGRRRLDARRDVPPRRICRLSADHPASFRKYLLERLIVKTGMTRYHLLDVEHDAARGRRPRRP
jgi:glucosamine-6-phosphate deaminase